MKLTRNKSKSKIHKRIDRAIWLVILLFGSYYFYGYYICHNFKPVVPEVIYRSGQPEADELARWIDEHNIKSVINLRGWRTDMARVEQQICQEKGVDFYTLDLSAYQEMSREQLMSLLDTIETVKTPVLFHCRHGVDRSGTASALAAWILRQQSYGLAKWHSYVPPGPWKYKSWDFNHISNIFAEYENYCSENNLETDNIEQFENWARNVYKTDVTVHSVTVKSKRLKVKSSLLR